VNIKERREGNDGGTEEWDWGTCFDEREREEEWIHN
jgi:hypothetical protein